MMYIVNLPFCSYVWSVFSSRLYTITGYNNWLFYLVCQRSHQSAKFVILRVVLSFSYVVLSQDFHFSEVIVALPRYEVDFFEEFLLVKF